MTYGMVKMGSGVGRCALWDGEDKGWGRGDVTYGMVKMGGGVGRCDLWDGEDWGWGREMCLMGW